MDNRNVTSFLLANLEKSVARLTEALNYRPTVTNEDLEPEEMHELIQFATLRRVSVCFYGYLNYLVRKAEMPSDLANSMSFTEIFDHLVKKGYLSVEDRMLSDEFLRLYCDINGYQEGMVLNVASVLDAVPRIHNYMSRFVATEKSVMLPQFAGEQVTV